MRLWTPIKFKRVVMRQGYFPKKVNTGFLDWAYLMKRFNLHKNLIFRIRKNQGLLRMAVTRLEKLDVYKSR